MKPLTPFIRRKYLLNKKCKAFCKVSSRRRVVFIPEAEKEALTGRNKAYFEKLTDKFKYIIQYTMKL